MQFETLGTENMDIRRQQKPTSRSLPGMPLSQTVTSLPPILHMGLWLKCYLIRTALRLDKRNPPPSSSELASPLPDMPFSTEQEAHGPRGCEDAPAQSSYSSLLLRSCDSTHVPRTHCPNSTSFRRLPQLFPKPTLLRIQRVAICRRCGWASGVQTGMLQVRPRPLEV